MTQALFSAAALPTGYDFAHNLLSAKESPRFGIDKQKTAEALRELADHIEDGHFILLSGGVYTQARREDFTMTVLNLKFTEKSSGNNS